MADQESLQFSFSASTKVWIAIVTVVGTLGSSVYAVVSWVGARSDLHTQSTKLDDKLEAELSVWEGEKADLREALCLQRAELRLLAAAVVRTKAADAEPVRARRAETASSAYSAFMDATREWGSCKDSVHIANERLRDRPLNAAWRQTLGTPPPNSD